MSEAESIGDILGIRSFADMRVRLGAWLRLSDAVSEEVLVAVISHPSYARRLAAARNFPEAVAWLIARPPALPDSARRMVDAMAHQTGPDNPGLLATAAKALMRWTADGFRFVDEETRQRRWAACQACPHLREPRAKGLHQVIKLMKPEARICGLCGCVASAKVRLRQERCPDADPANPSQTRWTKAETADRPPGSSTAEDPSPELPDHLQRTGVTAQD